VNIYSYESDLSLGGEWWIGRKRGKRDIAVKESVRGVEGRDARTGDGVASLRDVADTQVRELDSPIPLKSESVSPTPVVVDAAPGVGLVGSSQDRDGVLKARISGNWVSKWRSPRAC
jgi:distribution and morphology protein 10